MKHDPLTLDVAIESPLWQAVPEVEALIDQTAAMAVMTGKLRHAPGAEVSFVLTDDASIRAINKQWRHQDKPTNVLSFPQAEGAAIAATPVLGDIVLAFETIETEARDMGLALADHVRHLVVHGLLHLFGHDHIIEAEAERMEALEIAILARLDVANPYADAPLAQLAD